MPAALNRYLFATYCICLCLLQIGGTEEYKICEAIKQGRITKPVVCWCIGTCATMFSSEVRGQVHFRHL